jgi:hypothetical protein
MRPGLSGANVQRGPLKRRLLESTSQTQRPDPNGSTSATFFDTGYEVLANYSLAHEPAGPRLTVQEEALLSRVFSCLGMSGHH